MTKTAVQPLQIHAPMTGVLRSLDEVPDPAFSQRLIGDGIAIDPLDELVRAPFAGSVVAVAPTGHSVTVRSHDGVEVLIHIGIDTVGLKGRGFTPLVDAGQSVECGEGLIELDLDHLGRNARSLITPIILVSDHVLVPGPAGTRSISAGAPLFMVEARTSAGQAPGGLPVQRSTAHVYFELGLPNGLHARPSARIAELARTFDGSIAVMYGGKSADATSITSLMALGATMGSEIEIRAVGDRPREIAVALTTLLEALAETERTATEVATPRSSSITVALSTIDLSAAALVGVVASPGLAVGPVFRLRIVDIEIDAGGRGVEEEGERLGIARAQLGRRLMDDVGLADPIAKDIAEAHLALLGDRELTAVAECALEMGASAEHAWRTASRAQEMALEATGNARLRERAIDLRDVERRLLAILTGADLMVARAPPPGAIVVSDDIEPSVLMNLQKAGIAGICTARGGATSHAAILAAAAGIPMLVAVGDEVLAIEDGRCVLLDAEAGRLDPSPSATAVEQVTARAAQLKSDASLAKTAAQSLCHLADGARIEVFANLAGLADAHDARELGAEGCGLLRTEFIFAGSSTPPDEETQRRLYADIAEALEGRPLIIRTLDVGGDKPIAYLPFPDEPNPALGMRGIRFALQEHHILKTQIRAMIRGVAGSQLRIMLPMIVETDEIDRVRELVDLECASLGVRPDIQIGVMVETPAAALLADQLAERADFLSIGSNDLSQYVLAMDRGNAPLAARVDAYHPAVLRAIRMTAEGAARHGRWLGICGGLASDPLAAPLLVGLGCQELSAVPSAVPRVKQTLRGWTIARCEDLAARAVLLRSAAEVRSLVSGEVR